MEQSILKGIKKMLSIGDDDTAFDFQIITNINSAFSTLTDIGIGPEAGFVIEDDTAVWADFLADDAELSVVKLSKVKTVVETHARLRFDPPNSSFLLDLMKQNLLEETWRLSVNRESTDYVDPDPPVTFESDSLC